MCLGHESSGVIVKLGPDVTKTRKLELGQRVALEPGVVCRVCEFCKAGQYEVSLLFHSQWGDGVRGGDSLGEGENPPL
jgi:threonine dehydrogenase-like Zn-dependent dehydrogenase